MSPKCIACGSTDLIDDVSVIDAYYGSPVLLRTYEAPEAFLFKGTKKTATEVQVCGKCGYVMMFASREGIAELRMR